MSEDESVEAGRHTSQAFKALLSAALVVADAQRQRAVREMRRMESEARDREREANQRGQLDATLGRLDTTTTAAGAGMSVSVAVAMEDPVELAQRWAAAQQPDADPAQRVELDKQVRDSGVDPDQVRAEHPEVDFGPSAVEDAGRASAEPAGRSTDRVQHEGVWQDGSPEVAKAGLSYTRTPGRTITPGLGSQRRPKTPGRTAAKTRDMGR
ncbi:hypothetical protein RHODO2019_18895 (plasmid) [Rhodococcus antarcticus]|uniref:Colicin import membrane protein n=1 Tax=Rhodococcus antarcticus TaxID=2987751 RepID=A0ABY6P5K7_9NOCA|nr:hypothetical protein [Rhodococcus antarcticus]UZJ26955.1 hypothetical protein RHODO2019_18895 [Rhodococcus antarcticus]